MTDAATPKKPPDPPDKRRDDFPNLKTHPVPEGHMREYESTYFDRYLELDFEGAERRHINPYQIEREIEKCCGGEIAGLVGNTRSKLTIQTRNAEQTRRCLQITSLGEYKCTVRAHPRFNSCVGLIYLRSFDISDMDAFRGYLNEQDRDNRVEKVEQANFIKTSVGITAYLITFNREQTPYSIYIPGEPADTVVRDFKSKPMLCRNCLTYGHSTSKCKKSDPVCQNCAEEGHNKNSCQSKIAKCKYCREDNSHMTGAKECPVQMREQKITDIVQKEKVSFQRARQIVEHVPSVRPPKPANQIFPRRLEIKLLDGHTVRRTLPWTLEKSIVEHLGKKPVYLRRKTNEESTLIVEIATKDDAINMRRLEKLGNIPVEISTSDSRNPEKGLIYIQGYDLLDDESYRESLKQQYDLAKVEMASWIKTKNSNTRALLLTFNGGTEIPEFIDIPGESARTRIYEYKRMPTLCSKCLEFGHPSKVCRSQERCSKCAAPDHKAESCTNEIKCFYCQDDHETGNKKLCQEYLNEEEILFIQSQSQISRTQAKVIFGQRRAEAKGLNYAGVTRKTIAANQTKHLEPNNTQNTTSKKPQAAAANKQKPNKPRDPDEWHTLTKKNTISPKRKETSPSPQVTLSSPKLNKANESAGEDYVAADMDDYYGSIRVVPPAGQREAEPSETSKQTKRAHSSSENDSNEMKARRLEDRSRSQTHNRKETRYMSENRAPGREKERLNERDKHSEEWSQQHEGKNREEKKTTQQSQSQHQPRDKKRGEKKNHTDYEKFVNPNSRANKNNKLDKEAKNRP